MQSPRTIFAIFGLADLQMLHWISLSALLLCFLPATAQVDSLPQVGEDPAFFLEDILSNSDEEIDFDFNALYEDLAVYREHPLNLNEATAEQLADLQFLSEIQIDRLIQYRETAGPFIAIYELQAIPGFDLTTIKYLLPFVRVGGSLDDYQVPITQMLYKGQNEIITRWTRVLETQRGFTPPTETSTTRYLGDPNRVYFRYRHTYENKLSYGITAEKDAGEEFFAGSNPAGFDFYSAHLYLRDYNNWLRAVAIGDFSVSLGQGLILQLGFGSGKSGFTTSISRTQRALSAYTSVNEASFFRGIGTSLQLGEHIEVTLFGSSRQLDGNVVEVEVDTVGIDPSEVGLIPDQANLSSIYNSGFHRTQNEIEDKGAVNNLTVGGRVKFTGKHWDIAFNTVYDQLDRALVPNPQPYNLFYFTGTELMNNSIDYSFRIQNFRFFGETARSSNNGLATVNGLLIGLDRRIDLAIYQRAFGRDFQTLRGNPIAETSGVRNEQGLYLGTEIRPNKFWRFNAYLDLWKHPWLRFATDAPTNGHEWLVRLTYYQKRKLEVYAQARGEIKYRNLPDNTTKVDFTVPNDLLRFRTQFSYKVTKALELRTRFDASVFQTPQLENPELGFLIYQDIIYKPIGFPLSFTSRFALFETDSYNSRLYAYENDILYSFSIPAYFNTGSRFYINLRYKGIRNLTVEARFAQSYFSNQNLLSDLDTPTPTVPFVIGSGLDEIQGNTRTEVKFQLQYKF